MSYFLLSFLVAKRAVLGPIQGHHDETGDRILEWFKEMEARLHMGQ